MLPPPTPSLPPSLPPPSSPARNPEEEANAQEHLHEGLRTGVLVLGVEEDEDKRREEVDKGGEERSRPDHERVKASVIDVGAVRPTPSVQGVDRVVGQTNGSLGAASIFPAIARPRISGGRVELRALRGTNFWVEVGRAPDVERVVVPHPAMSEASASEVTSIIGQPYLTTRAERQTHTA